MTAKEFRAFLDKSGLPISYVARESGVGRTQVSYFANDFCNINPEHRKKIKKFTEEYKQRWQD